MRRAAARLIDVEQRLQHIESLSNQVLGPECDAAELAVMRKRLLADADTEASASDRDRRFVNIRSRAFQSLEANGAVVETSRFTCQIGGRLALGCAAFVSRLPEPGGLGQAVVQLLRYGPGEYYLSVDLKFCLPMECQHTAVTNRSMLPTLNARLKQLGFQVDLQRALPVVPLMQRATRDDGPRSDPRWIDFAPGTSRAHLNPLIRQLERRYRRVMVHSHAGLYTVAALGRKKKP